ncbi:MAG: hypothetical protein MZV64_00085 [Ignavibacteriales bacterium]|nr:hypothetical protein [Ignavibacteriales bacterium]
MTTLMHEKFRSCWKMIAVTNVKGTARIISASTLRRSPNCRRASAISTSWRSRTTATARNTSPSSRAM